MSILIKGVEMPKDCMFCPMAHWNKIDRLTGCEVVGGKRYAPEMDTVYWESGHRPDWCPLVEVPKHGRLIDADALMDGWMHLRDAIKYGNKNAEQQRHSYSTMMMYEIANEIDDAPTIIEAEE